jgi:hypothetical protein
MCVYWFTARLNQRHNDCMRAAGCPAAAVRVDLWVHTRSERQPRAQARAKFLQCRVLRGVADAPAWRGASSMHGRGCIGIVSVAAAQPSRWSGSHGRWRPPTKKVARPTAPPTGVAPLSRGREPGQAPGAWWREPGSSGSQGARGRQDGHAWGGSRMGRVESVEGRMCARAGVCRTGWCHFVAARAYCEVKGVNRRRGAADARLWWARAGGQSHCEWLRAGPLRAEVRRGLPRTGAGGMAAAPLWAAGAFVWVLARRGAPGALRRAGSDAEVPGAPRERCARLGCPEKKRLGRH